MGADESPALEDHLAWLAMSGLPHIGGRSCRRLLDGFGSVRAALEAPPESWEEVIGAAGRRARSVPVPWQWAASQLEALQRCNGQLLTLEDPRYPHLLAETAAPPPVLFVLGTLPPDLPCIALVGTRRASHSGRRMAHRLALDLVAAGFCVVSGMAWGIDASAHEGALEGGGRTLAVLGCGADVVYPRSHVDLYRAIRRQGAVVSEFPMGSGATAGWFPRRNRVISGLSLGTIVVEAPARSGALITASYALEQNREVFAVPGDVLKGNSRGCHQLLKEGAKLVEDAEDVMEELDHWRTSPSSAPVAAATLTGAEGKVFNQLGAGPCHVDDLAQEVDMAPAQLLDVLLRLELEGRVDQLPGKHFVRRAV